MSLSKIAILGCQGQLGSSLRRLLQERALGLTRAELDIAITQQVREKIPLLPSEIIINCAAYNLVDKAEEDPQAAWELNFRAPLELAQICAESGKKLIQVSTDYVFSNDKKRMTPYTEQDLPGPETVYGISKLAGELAVQAYCPDHLIVRTCGLFGKSERGGKMNFIDLMLKKAGEGQPLKIVYDQICSPTSTDDLAEGILELIKVQAKGVYHVVNTGATTWHDFAHMVFAKKGLHPEVIPVTTASFGAKAKRPGYSVLATDRYTQATGKSMTNLETAVDQYFSKY